MTEELYWAIAGLLHSIKEFEEQTGMLTVDVLKKTLLVSQEYLAIGEEWPSRIAEFEA